MDIKVKPKSKTGWCYTRRHAACIIAFSVADGSTWECGCECHTDEDFQKVNLVPVDILAKENSKVEVKKYGPRCLCCGEPTKGGKFLPGHDSKYLTTKIAQLEGPWQPVYDQLVVEVSPAFADKFKKRVYGS
jgi:hypothetical protein